MVGLEVVNSNNQIVIDSTYRNLALVRVATVQLFYITNENIDGSINLTHTGTLPVIAIGNTNGAPVTLWSAEKDGNTFNYRICTDYAHRNTSITVYIFDTPPSVAGSGLTVWDADGRVVFNSDFDYLRPIDMTSFDIDANWGAGDGGLVTKSYSVKPAVVICKAAIRAVHPWVPPPNPPFPVSYYAPGITVDGYNVNIASMRIYQTPFGVSQHIEWPGGNSVLMTINASML